MNRRNLIKIVCGGLISSPVLNLSAKPKDLTDINYLIELFTYNGYYVTPTKMYAPVALYSFEKKDIYTFPSIPAESGPYMAVEASMIRYKTVDDLIRWIELDKKINPNNIFIPYKSGNTKFTMPSDDDRRSIHFENFNFVRGVWFDPKSFKVSKHYHISSISSDSKSAK